MADDNEKNKTFGYLLKRMCYWVSIGRENSIVDSSLPLVSHLLGTVLSRLEDMVRRSSNQVEKIRTRTSRISTGSIQIAKDTANVILCGGAEVRSQLDSTVRSTMDKLFVKDEGLNKEQMTRDILNPSEEGQVGLDSLMDGLSTLQKNILDGVQENATTLIRKAYGGDDNMSSRLQAANKRVCQELVDAAFEFSTTMIGSSAVKMFGPRFRRLGFDVPQPGSKTGGLFGQAAVDMDEVGEVRCVPALIRGIKQAVETFVGKYNACMETFNQNIQTSENEFQDALTLFYDGDETHKGIQEVINWTVDPENEDGVQKLTFNAAVEIGQRLVDALSQIYG